MAMHGEFHIFSNFVNGFDWRIETTNRLQIVGITFHLLHWLLVIPIMQMIGTTFHHLLDRQKHTCRPSRQHRSEGIQATAGQRFAGSSRTRPTQPSPGGFCMSKNQRTVCQCQLSRPPISQKYPANSHENSQNYQYRQPANLAEPRQKIPCGDRRRTTHSSRPPCSPLIVMMMLFMMMMMMTMRMIMRSIHPT